VATKWIVNTGGKRWVVEAGRTEQAAAIAAIKKPRPIWRDKLARDAERAAVKMLKQHEPDKISELMLVWPEGGRRHHSIVVNSQGALRRAGLADKYRLQSGAR
jgi:hypothetical protein